jgi:hypothetical protein
MKWKKKQPNRSQFARRTKALVNHGRKLLRARLVRGSESGVLPM